jgi:hypothetical protein
MDARAWVHLAVMIVPVAILTVFNVLGLRPSPELAGALSALTTAAAVLTQVRRPQGSTARKVRSGERPPKKLAQHGAPSRVIVPGEGEHRGP